MESVQSQSATFYHETSAHQSCLKEVGLNLVAQSNIVAGTNILDLGCGTGYLATVLSESVGPEGKVVAVDPDVERIELAKEKNARSNIEYLVANDQSFPGYDYQLIISNHVIHWIKNKEAAFKRIYERLSLGGKFLFVSYNGTPEMPPVVGRAFSDLIAPDFKDYLLRQKMTFLNSNEYHAIAQSVGLTITNVQVQESYIQWKSVDDFLHFWAWICHGEIDLESIDPMVLQDFKKENEEKLVLHCIPHQVLYMECTKTG